MKNPFEFNNLKKTAKIIATSAVLMGGMSPENTVSGQSNKPKIEHSIEVSSNTKWAEEALNEAKNDIQFIEDANDAFAFSIKVIKPFNSHIGMLSEGAEKNTDYSFQDYKYLLKKAKELHKILNDFDQKFEINRSHTMEHVIHILEMRSTYSGFQQHQLLKKG